MCISDGFRLVLHPSVPAVFMTSYMLVVFIEPVKRILLFVRCFVSSITVVVPTDLPVSSFNAVMDC